MIEDDRLKIENRLRDGAILDPQSSILNLRSSIFDPQPSIPQAGIFGGDGDFRIFCSTT